MLLPMAKPKFSMVKAREFKTWVKRGETKIDENR